MLRKLCALFCTPTRAPGRGRFVPGLERLEGRAVPATFLVTATLDAVAADGRLSLREAISAANAHPGPDTIVLPAGVYRLALAGADDTNARGDLDVTGSTLLRGAGAGATAVDGRQLDRVFDVLGTAPGSIQVTFQGLTVRNGLADAGGGGGIRVGNADLLLQGCAITANRTSGEGGGISNIARPGTGNVTLVHTRVDRNVASSGGGLRVRANDQGQGSVLNVSGSTIRHNIARDGGGIRATRVNLTDSTVSDNSATADDGGGIKANTATLTNSTVSGNHAGFSGGGIRATTATLTNSTVTGNFAVEFGGGFNVDTLTLTSSTVTGNHADHGGGMSVGQVTLTSCTVSGNAAGDTGGGIDATTVTLNGSTVGGNTAGGDGGGIDADTVTLNGSTVRGNHAGRDGGGINASLAANLTGSTVSGNRADEGGGLFASVTATLINSTVSGNSAFVKGGGISAHGLTLLNVTVTDNSALTAAGGVFLQQNGTSSVRNSIIAGNLADLDGDGPDVSGAFTSGGHNLVGDSSGTTGFVNGVNGDQVGTAADPIDPRLGALAFHGGPTRTHALLPGSPAIDRGDNNAPATDQRGVVRGKDGDGNGSRVFDIGAFER